MKRLVLVPVLLVVGSLPPAAAVEVDAIVEIHPFLIQYFPEMADLDLIVVSQSGTLTSGADVLQNVPGLMAGVGLDTKIVRFDVTVGGGRVADLALDGSPTGKMLRADLAARFTLGKVTVGPRVGLVRFFDFEWEGKQAFEPVVFPNDVNGFATGVDLTVGKGKVAFVTGIEGMLAEDLDVVRTGDNVTISRDTISLSGFGLRAGILMRF